MLRLLDKQNYKPVVLLYKFYILKITFGNKVIKNEHIIQVQNGLMQWLLCCDRYIIFVFFMFQVVQNTYFSCFAAFKHWDYIILKPLEINISVYNIAVIVICENSSGSAKR